MNLHTVLFVVVVVYSTQAFGDDMDKNYGEDEAECTATGGKCYLKEQCNPSPSKPGLCPKQADKGFECCTGFPKDENRCKKLGGDCFEKSHCSTPIAKATDCGADKDCCPVT